MSFGENLDKLLPPYLASSEKSRLKDALAQFMPEHRGKEISYNEFYKTYNADCFRQADLVKDIRFARWNDKTTEFEKKYVEAIIISNTCDISFDNQREVNEKQCLFAPLMNFSNFISGMKSRGIPSDRIDSHITNIKAQLISNILYLPEHNGLEYIALLDQVFWFPVKELHSFLDTLEEERIASLSHYGYYLFLLKLSYHLCRLPEQCDREVLISV